MTHSLVFCRPVNERRAAAAAFAHYTHQTWLGPRRRQYSTTRGTTATQRTSNLSVSSFSFSCFVSSTVCLNCDLSFPPVYLRPTESLFQKSASKTRTSVTSQSYSATSSSSYSKSGSPLTGSSRNGMGYIDTAETAATTSSYTATTTTSTTRPLTACTLVLLYTVVLLLFCS